MLPRITGTVIRMQTNESWFYWFTAVMSLTQCHMTISHLDIVLCDGWWAKAENFRKNLWFRWMVQCGRCVCVCVRTYMCCSNEHAYTSIFFWYSNFAARAQVTRCSCALQCCAFRFFRYLMILISKCGRAVKCAYIGRTAASISASAISCIK